MKVIKKQDVSNWSYKHVCANCDSELQVEQSDLFYLPSSGDQREFISESYRAYCAVCSKVFTIPINNIPKLIQIEVRKKAQKPATGGYFDR